MKTSERKLTANQERLAYRRAVQRSLEVFFEKTPEDAANLVERWWMRMIGTASYTTGLFMHDEPLNTAADLAGSRRAPAIREVSQRYSQIIAEAMPKLRKSRNKNSNDKSYAAHAA